MSRRLEPQPWMTDPGVVAVFDALEAAGGAGCVRFVGGCLRNALSGHPVADVDLATSLRPEAVMAALEAAGLRALPTGLEHGTVTALSGGRTFEITTLRRDVATDGRRAVVAFTEDWAEDAARRDFRLNALYADREGRLYDPTGCGVADAEAGRIVFVGDPAGRIREDYLRILRFFRFFAWYGRGQPDAAALDACAALKDGMARLSAERVSSELLKLLAAPDPAPAVRLMARSGVLAQVLPEAGSLDLFEGMVAVTADPLLRLSSLLPPDPQAAARIAETLRLSNAQRDRLAAMVGGAVRVALDMDPPAARAALYRLGRQAFEDRVHRAWAAAPLQAAAAAALLELAASWPIPRLPVGGREVAAAGLPPGPATGRVLQALEDWWVANDFPQTGLDARLAELVAEDR